MKSEESTELRDTKKSAEALFFTIPYLIPHARNCRIARVRLVIPLLKGFAIPVTGRKTTEVHARYIHPTTPLRAWMWIIHTHGTFIVAVTTSYEFCEDSEKSRTTFQ